MGMTASSDDEKDVAVGIADYFNQEAANDAPQAQADSVGDKKLMDDMVAANTKPVKTPEVTATDLPAAQPTKKQTFKEAYAAARAKYKETGVDEPFQWEGKPGMRYSALTAEETAAKKAGKSKPAPKPAQATAPKAAATEQVPSGNVGWKGEQIMVDAPKKAPTKPVEPKKPLRQQNTVMDQGKNKRQGLYASGINEMAGFFDNIDSRLEDAASGTTAADKLKASGDKR